MLWKTIEAHWRIIAATMLLAMLVFTAKIARTNYDRALLAEHELKLAKDAVKDMQARQRDIAALDIKVTQELANAKSEVDRLRTSLGNGTKRLRIAASCPKLPETTATTGKPDAASPRYDAEFERNYLSLVERIRQSETMIDGLQSYIRNQCQ